MIRRKWALSIIPQLSESNLPIFSARADTVWRWARPVHLWCR